MQSHQWSKFAFGEIRVRAERSSHYAIRRIIWSPLCVFSKNAKRQNAQLYGRGIILSDLSCSKYAELVGHRRLPLGKLRPVVDTCYRMITIDSMKSRYLQRPVFPKHITPCKSNLGYLHCFWTRLANNTSVYYQFVPTVLLYAPPFKEILTGSLQPIGPTVKNNSTIYHHPKQRRPFQSCLH